MRRLTIHALLLGAALGSGCGGAPAASASTSAPANEAPGTEGDPRAAALRGVLRGATLSDADVLFIDEALRASGTDYTEDGLATYREWEITAVVTATDGGFRLGASSPRVNAEWELSIDRASGRVTMEMTATLEEPPPE